MDKNALRITYRPIADLIPYARNSRTHSDAQVAQIAVSIREFGWTNPVLVDGDSGVIAGHGRILAARQLGLAKVPCIELAGMTEAQKRAYVIADNKLALNAGWDDEALRVEIFSSMIVWVKPSLVLSQTDYQSRHEPCLYGWLEGATHSWYADRKQTSVWEFGKESVEGHTTPKPVALIEEALGNSSRPGDIVADLFGGSGSTMIACETACRQARLMELDPRYVDVIVKRWQAFTGKQATLEADGRTFAEVAGELEAA